MKARQRLVQAAIRLVWHEGYAAVSVEAICARGLVKKADFSRLFASKDELMIEALDAHWQGRKVVLDDLFNELFPAVSEGAQRFLRAHPDVAVVGAGGNKTFLCHTDHAHTYRDAMTRRAQRLHLYHQTHTFLGAPFLSVFPRTKRASVDYWRAYVLQWLRSRSPTRRTTDG